MSKYFPCIGPFLYLTGVDIVTEAGFLTARARDFKAINCKHVLFAPRNDLTAQALWDFLGVETIDISAFVAEFLTELCKKAALDKQWREVDELLRFMLRWFEKDDAKRIRDLVCSEFRFRMRDVPFLPRKSGLTSSTSSSKAALAGASSSSDLMFSSKSYNCDTILLFFFFLGAAGFNFIGIAREDWKKLSRDEKLQTRTVSKKLLETEYLIFFLE